MVIGCDKNQLATVDSPTGTPSVLSLDISPDSLNIDSLQPVNGVYTVPFIVAAKVSDPDGLADISKVVARLMGLNSTSTLVERSLLDDGVAPDSAAGDGIFSGQPQVGITRSQIGRYRALVIATDKNGIQSNAGERTLLLWKNNSPPSISLFPSIRQFSPPAGDSTLLTVSIAAADSDGLSDISIVSVSARNSTDSSARTLFDDGLPLHGDLFPGDGVFSSVFWSRPLAGLQNLELVFVAQDTRGSISESVRRTLQNSSPHILRVTTPDSIQRPSSGSQLVPFFLAAIDSNGLGDIDSAYFRNISSTNPTDFLMYDDGDLVAHGDSTRGDGTYSRIVSVDATTSLGRKEFHFHLVDKSGARDMLIRFITIY